MNNRRHIRKKPKNKNEKSHTYHKRNSEIQRDTTHVGLTVGTSYILYMLYVVYKKSSEAKSVHYMDYMNHEMLLNEHRIENAIRKTILTMTKNICIYGLSYVRSLFSASLRLSPCLHCSAFLTASIGRSHSAASSVCIWLLNVVKRTHSVTSIK